METPTARVMKKETWRMGASQVDPIRTYYIGLSPFHFLELSGRITEYLDTREDIEHGDWEGYGNIKDKAIDLKIQFLPETKYFPALALGIMDPHGTRLQGAQYVVASKQIYPFDFSIGFGNGRYGKKPLSQSGENFEIELFSHPRSWRDDAQMFFGLQFEPTNKFALMVEYSPIEREQIYLYQPDSSDEMKSRYNFGLRYRPIKNAEIDLSYQRGTKFGLNVSLLFEIGKALIPILDLPYKKDGYRDNPDFETRLATILLNEGFSDIGVSQIGSHLWIEAQNDRYFYAPKAVAVILRDVTTMLPDTVDEIHVTLKNNGIPIVTFSSTRHDMQEWKFERLNSRQYLMVSDLYSKGCFLKKARGLHGRKFTYNLEPALKTFLNDPSGFFKYNIGVRGWVESQPWRGGSFITGVEAYPLNNISTINDPLSVPVRSDIALYEKNRLAVSKVMFEQIEKFPFELYGRLAAGWLEVEYAGLDTELAVPFRGGRFMAGISSSLVKKREPETILQIKDDAQKCWYSTVFLNARLNHPESGFSIDVKAGRFLAGDRGARITVSKFIKGVTVSAWYSATNTKRVFSDEHNRGYYDKGISVSLPIRLISGKESKTVYKYSLAPWTRDVAQDIHHHDTLFDYMGREQKTLFYSDSRHLQP